MLYMFSLLPLNDMIALLAVLFSITGLHRVKIYQFTIRALRPHHTTSYTTPLSSSSPVYSSLSSSSSSSTISWSSSESSSSISWSSSESSSSIVPLPA
ncbi:hypothetical protein C2E23DRAFT_356977 [Lenzites betulinus]|nr:hypothetical protein C2E23DRAFT_356977 [Lenzites betulinus]